MALSVRVLQRKSEQVMCVYTRMCVTCVCIYADRLTELASVTVGPGRQEAHAGDLCDSLRFSS